MHSSRVGYWLQVGANVGILVGLVMVALQMQQNEKLLRYQLLKQETDSYVASEMAIAGEDYAGVWTRVQLDPFNAELRDMRIMESSMWGLAVYKWTRNYQLYEAGLMTEKDWQAAIDNDLVFVFGNPYGRGWWDAYLEDFGEGLPDELRHYADQRIKATPLDATATYFKAIRRHVAKYEPDPSE